MFSKRHYEAIAAVMQSAHPGNTDIVRVGQWLETCKDLAELFDRDNRHFNIIRFMRSCVPGANVKARPVS